MAGSLVMKHGRLMALMLLAKLPVTEKEKNIQYHLKIL